jgi:hypothetical protein
MTKRDHFEVLLLLARPGAGKSEVIDYLKRTSPKERLERFHIGKLVEIDDFPMLWTWFEEDALLEKMGCPRIHTDADGYFLWQHLWDLLIERIGLEYQKAQRDLPDLDQACTVLVEFSRGSEHGGYRSAFQHLSTQLAQKMAILYIEVSWEESLRKNRKRFNPDRPDSILEHGMTDDKLERLYRENDWAEMTRDDPDFLVIQECRVPFVSMPNEDDVTTRGGETLGKRLEEYMANLWEKYR